MPKKKLFLLVIFLATVSVGYAQTWLFNNGKTSYSIYTTNHKVVKELADTLANYLSLVSGATFLVKNSETERQLRFILLDAAKHQNLGEEGFNIRTVNKSILLEANTITGLQHATYTFIESYLKCRLYGDDAVVTSKIKSLLLPVITRTEVPSFAYRSVHYYDGYQQRYAKWHKLNIGMARPGQLFVNAEKKKWGLWVHTLFQFVDPKIHFENHPEYFCLRNGMRQPEQLCLSNKHVLQIVIDSLQQKINRNPAAVYWSISQMDNYSYCTCDECAGVDAAEQSNSGTYIKFINEVAAHYPGKMISTLAYQFTRKAPVHVKPAANVNIMLCSIESPRDKPLEQEQGEQSFKNDLISWSKLTNNIIIWDYVVNFWNLLSPLPNFKILQPNLQLFAKYKVPMLFEQGAGSHGEMDKLRTYLLSKLLWDVNANTDSLIRDFCDGYFGKGGKYIYQYIKKLEQNSIEYKSPVYIYEYPIQYKKTHFAWPHIDEYKDLFFRAFAAVGNNTTLKNRVEKEMLAIRYLELELAKDASFTGRWIFDSTTFIVKKYYDDLLEDFYTKCKKHKQHLIHELSPNIDEYYALMKDYFKNGVELHKAVNKKIVFEGNSYSVNYKADGVHTLVDGVHGTDNYRTQWLGWEGNNMSALIDLGNETTIKEINCNFLVKQSSWVFAPAEIIIEAGNDLKEMKPVAMKLIAEARNVMKDEIIKIHIPVSFSKPAKYIRVKVSGIGPLPQWHSASGRAWFFIDEIVVK